MPRIHPRPFKLEFLEMGSGYRYFFKRAPVDSTVRVNKVILKQQAFVFIRLDI